MRATKCSQTKPIGNQQDTGEISKLLLGLRTVACTEELAQLHTLCGGLLGAVGFQGTQPVTLRLSHLKFLRPGQYYASEKTDGARYMLLIVPGLGSFAVDRRFTFKQLHNREEIVACGTALLDGELVQSTTDGHVQPRFLVHDACAADGKVVTPNGLHKRLGAARKVLAELSGSGCTSIPSLSFELKDFFDLSGLPPAMLAATGDYNDTLRGSVHRTDGVIFTPIKEKYVLGVNKRMYKWKWAPTLDILVERAQTNSPPSFAAVGQDGAQRRRVSNLVLTLSPMLDHACKEGLVVECSYAMDTEQWVAVRLRSDKSKPNSMHTIEAVVQAVNDGITSSMLVEHCK